MITATEDAVMKQVVDEIVGYVESTGAPVQEAIETLWSTILPKLTDEELDSLARRGLVGAVNQVMTQIRYPKPIMNGDKIRVASQSVEVTPVVVRVSMWQRVHYEMDGKQIPLIRFIRPDWESMEHRETVNGKGAFRRARFARKMVKVLDEHQTDRTADLPNQVLAELAAESPWATD